MKVAFVVFNGLTLLDFVGVYDPITRLKSMQFLPDLTWDICALTPEVVDSAGLALKPTRVAAPLTDYELVIIPGGLATRQLRFDEAYLSWIKTAAGARLKVSVCTGALIWGAAGFLAGHTATTHPTAFDLLRPYCAAIVERRIVDEGEIVTARGVTAALDLGLYLCEKLAGREAREKICQQMDYPYGEAAAIISATPSGRK